MTEQSNAQVKDSGKKGNIAEQPNDKGKDAGKRGNNNRDRYIQMVMTDPKTRVTRVDTNDTHVMLEFAQQVNRIITRARAQAGRRVEINQFVEIISKFDDMVLRISDQIEELAEMAHVDYRKPGIVQKIEERKAR